MKNDCLIIIFHGYILLLGTLTFSGHAAAQSATRASRVELQRDEIWQARESTIARQSAVRSFSQSAVSQRNTTEAAVIDRILRHLGGQHAPVTKWPDAKSPDAK